jgi:hypothetical protein
MWIPVLARCYHQKREVSEVLDVSEVKGVKSFADREDSLRWRQGFADLLDQEALFAGETLELQSEARAAAIGDDSGELQFVIDFREFEN